VTPLPVVLAASASNGKALWYLTRASGVVALVLLTATVVVGVVASVGWTTERWPRFLSQHLHRNLSLLCLGFVATHVLSTIADGYVPIGIVDAFVPFHSPYRPLWVGLGAVTLDLLLAVLVTSALRHRIGYRSWRFVHWMAYLCWPIAVLHGLGSGSDTRLGPVLVIDGACTLAVLAVVTWRLVTGRSFGATRRLVAAAVAVVVTVAIGAFAVLGPLRPGWSHRAGTSSTLLARIAATNAGLSVPTTVASATTAPTVAVSSGGATDPAPAAPFTSPVSGTQTTAPEAGGNVRVTLALRLEDAASTPLEIELDGTAIAGGGVSLSSGSASLGGYPGAVTSLDGDVISIALHDPDPVDLTVTLGVEQNGRLSGTVSGVAR
jgi:hypothetical protein